MDANPAYNFCPASERVYRRAYADLRVFMKTRGIMNIDDGLRLCFEEWSGRYMASTLSTRLSGIKGIMLKERVPFSDSTIMCIQRCIANMQRASPAAKQADVFSLDDFRQYLNYDHQSNADTLLKKMVFIVGVFCLLRGQEFRALTRQNVRIEDDGIRVHYYRPKTDRSRKGTTGWVPLKVCSISIIDIFREYLTLISRDGMGLSGPLFCRVNKAKNGYVGSVIGKNTFDKLAREIAAELGKEDPKRYTTHSFRRSGATILAALGLSNEELRQMGDWKSPQVAARYVDEAGTNKEAILKKAFQLSPVKDRKRDCGFESVSSVIGPNAVIQGNVYIYMGNAPTAPKEKQGEQKRRRIIVEDEDGSENASEEFFEDEK